jgi:glutamyl-tRNA synthetase
VIVGRLAPTPSGHLHLGNALAFGAAWLSARGAGGKVLLRIEDLDRGRARAEVAQGQRDDLRWLGIDWDEEVAPQSARTYSLDRIPHYRCDCTRALRSTPGACRCRDAGKAAGAARLRSSGLVMTFTDRALGTRAFASTEEPILVAADGQAGYPLAVVIDDARDGVTEVVRGADLLEATAAQLELHAALGLSPPSYLHVPVLHGEDGKKLSKSHGSTELRALRAAGWTPLRVWETLLPVLGLPPGPLAGARLVPSNIPPGPRVVTASGSVLG